MTEHLSSSQTDTLTAFDQGSTDLQEGPSGESGCVSDNVQVSSSGNGADSREGIPSSRPTREVGCRAMVDFGDPLPVTSTFWNNRFRRG
jgi:hypothetical protein